jgi:hypothetical protein
LGYLGEHAILSRPVRSAKNTYLAEITVADHRYRVTLRRTAVSGTTAEPLTPAATNLRSTSTRTNPPVDARREQAIRLMMEGEDGLMDDFTSREFSVHRIVR